MPAVPMDDVQTWFESLDVPPPPHFQSLEDFLTGLARSRGRHLQMLDAPLPPTKVCGLWIGRPDSDTIVVSDQLSGVQREHVVMHEVSHILLGHHGINRALAEQVQQCLEQSGDPTAVDNLMGRCRRYHDDDERAAELLASYYQAGTRGMQRGSWIHRPQARQAAAALFRPTR